MKITLENYEEYVLDYLEGNLKEEDENVFNTFLDHHPDIGEEIYGVEKFILIPDYQIQYPDKNSLYHKNKVIFLPFWNMSRLAAAAVALLLVSTASFFIWKSSITEDQHTLTVENEISNPNLYIGQTNIPTSKMTTPNNLTELTPIEEEPGNKAIAHKTPNYPDKLSPTSRVLASGSHQESTSIEQISEKAADELLANELTSINQSIEIEKETNLQDQRFWSNSDQRAQESVVAFLPVKATEITMDQKLKAPSLPVLSSSPATQTYRIHIPGEFLSETWTDMSLANFKKKAIPGFLIKQLNL